MSCFPNVDWWWLGTCLVVSPWREALFRLARPQDTVTTEMFQAFPPLTSASPPLVTGRMYSECEPLVSSVPAFQADKLCRSRATYLLLFFFISANLDVRKCINIRDNLSLQHCYLERGQKKSAKDTQLSFTLLFEDKFVAPSPPPTLSPCVSDVSSL